MPTIHSKSTKDLLFFPHVVLFEDRANKPVTMPAVIMHRSGDHVCVSVATGFECEGMFR